MATFDPKNLFDNFTFSTDLESQAGGVEMTESESVKLLLARFGIEDVDNLDQLKLNNALPYDLVRIADSGRRWSSSTPSDLGELSVIEVLMKTVVEALPPQLRTAEVLTGMDLRPVLHSLKGKTLKAGNTEYTVDTRVANAYIVKLNEDTKSALLASSVGTDTYEDRERQVDGLLKGYATTNVIGSVPSALPESTTTSGGLNDALSTGMDVGGQSLDELLKAFQLNNADDILYLQTLGYDMSPQAEANRPADQRIMLDIGTVAGDKPTYYRPGAPQGEIVGPRKAAELLYSGKVTPNQISQLQRRLAAAGYFDKTSEAFVPGDAFDRVTNTAWLALLGDSYRMQQSVDQILASRTKTRREQMPNLASNNYRNMMNQSAVQVIGRQLTDDEHSQLVSFLENLQGEKGVPIETGLIDTDVQEYFADEFAPEMEQYGLMTGSNTFLTALKSI
jgi:hypothetical protein